jgi:hypothetical protein
MYAKTPVGRQHSLSAPGRVRNTMQLERKRGNYVTKGFYQLIQNISETIQWVSMNCDGQVEKRDGQEQNSKHLLRFDDNEELNTAAIARCTASTKTSTT